MKNSGNTTSGKYSRVLAVYVILLALVSLLLGWIAFGLHAWLTFYNVLLVWVVLFAVLFYQIRKVNRDIARFFEVISNQDSIQKFDLSKSDRAFQDLHLQMNEVIVKLAGLRYQKEQDNQFFRSIFDHADIGLLVFDDEGKIVMINKTAISLLGTNKTAEMPEIISSVNKAAGLQTLIRLNRKGDQIQLSLRSRKIISDGKEYALVSLQNIRKELEQQEIESWQKLIRVFIHEIMNSVSPITITTSGIIALLEHPQNMTSEKHSEIVEGLKAIRKRSKGIAAFMDSYRQLSKVPVPDFKMVPVARLADNVGRFMKNIFESRSIHFSYYLSHKDIAIWCDEKLIEHVLINLLNNAADALENMPLPEIRLSGTAFPDRINISVHDNGRGINPEIIDSIFVPFFTTKPEGTGIGLSLSRQIMNLHGGSIFVHSKKGNTDIALDFLR